MVPVKFKLIKIKNPKDLEKLIKREQNKNKKQSSTKGDKNNKNRKKRVELKVRINVWKVIVAIVLFIFFAPFIVSIFEIANTSQKLDVSQALLDIKDKKVKEVIVQGNKLILTYNDNSVKTTTKENSDSFPSLLESVGMNPTDVKYSVVDQSLSQNLGNILGILLPIIIFGVIFFAILRAQNKSAQDIFSFGRSKARLFSKGKQNVTFSDVAGVDDAKKELIEIVDFLKNPAKYRKIGARTPKGVILFI